MNYFAGVGLINGIICLLIGLFVFMRERRNEIHKTFAVFSWSVALWCLFYSMWLYQETESAALIYVRWTMIFCYFIPPTFVLFARQVSGLGYPPNYKKIYYGPSIFFSLMTLTEWMVPSVEKRLFFNFWPVPGTMMHGYFVIFAITIIYGFYILFHSWKKAEDLQRNQLQWVIVTMLLIWGGGVTNWFLWYHIPIPPVPNFLVGLFFSVLAYAVLRRGLFDLGTLTDIVRETKLSTIGTLTASINHEIRNPLYVIYGLGQSYEQNIKEGMYKTQESQILHSNEIILKVMVQAKRAMEIIKQFSMYAKQTDVKVNNSQNVPLEDVFEDIMPLIRYELEANRIDIVRRFGRPLRVWADRGQLEEIFSNLIINAVQAIKPTEKTGRIEISAKEAGDKVEVLVKDDGPGIPKDSLHRIFEPFHTTKAEGTGLGLYITKQLVEKNGGQLKVSSQEGQGTTFSLLFQR